MAKKEAAKEPEKKDAKPAKAEEASAEEKPKKKLPIKAAILILVLLVLEGGALVAVLSMTGKPKSTHAAEDDIEAVEDGAAEKDDSHGKKKDDGHGKKDDGHGAKKDDGHGKKDDGHGKKDDGHGKKKDDGHGKKDDGHGKKDDGHGKKKDDGHGGAKASAAGPGELVEILVVKDRFPNSHPGRTWLWDSEIHVQAKGRNADHVNSVLTSRAAEIKTGVARIWRTAQHNHFNEPGLETLTRQIKEFLDDVLGATVDGKSYIERVLIPRCVGYPTDY